MRDLKNIKNEIALNFLILLIHKLEKYLNIPQQKNKWSQ